MRGVIYIRVSTEDQADSASMQEAGARRYAEAHDIEVVDVVRDIGVSGAEWVRRPGIARVLEGAQSRPRPFDVVVVRDLDRLGRDATRLPYFLARLHDEEVSVIEWVTGQVVPVDGMAMIISQIRSTMAQEERRMISQRTRNALAAKAERGLVVGGTTYGYLNERRADGVHHTVNETEAEVVREIFGRHAAGESFRRIAHQLNLRGVLSPRARGGGSGSWCGGTISEIIRSTRYRGDAVWGRVGSQYSRGSRQAVVRDEVIAYQVPAIVSPELWQRAQSRRDKVRNLKGYRPVRGGEPKYILVGNAICGHCGGPVGSWRTTYGNGATRKVVPAYRCLWHADRGDAVCSATYIRPAETLERELLLHVADALSPEAIAIGVREARAEIERESSAPDNRRAELEAAERDAAARV